jgi:hypothetical protein
MDPRFVAFSIIAVAIVAAPVVVWAIARSQRTAELRHRFGAEYDRTARMTGARKAEVLLMERHIRVESFPIRPLGAKKCEAFIAEWRGVQSCFVDDPSSAVERADHLVQRFMQAFGYPMADFEQRAADLSVAHSGVVDNYRAAHQIALRHMQGHATTEDLRTAILYYRSLFDDLVATCSTGLYKKAA